MNDSLNLIENISQISQWPIYRMGTVLLKERIPITRIEKLEDFLEFTRKFNSSSMKYIFRGQSDYSWPLTPTLARVLNKNFVSHDELSTQIKLFRKAIRGRVSDLSLFNDDADEELWAIGQHHGLKTHLLDWTYSPFVALFFAFKGDKKESNYRAVYVLNKEIVEDAGLIYEPRKDTHGRLINQNGLFIKTPIDTSIENAILEALGQSSEYSDLLSLENPEALSLLMNKVLIADSLRDEILLALMAMNINYSSLFPDLVGAALNCNWLLELKFNNSSDLLSEVVREIDGSFEIVPEVVLDDNNADLVSEAVNVETLEVARVELVEQSLGALDFLSACNSYLLNSFPEESGLDEITRLIKEKLDQLKVVDFEKKDSVLAQMRITLKKYLTSYSFFKEQNMDLIVQDIIGKYVLSKKD